MQIPPNPPVSEMYCKCMAGGDLYEVVAHVPGEHHVRQQPGVVARGEADLYQPLPVAEHLELRQSHLLGHLDRGVPGVPGVLQVGHGVAETLYLHRAHLRVWKLLNSNNEAVKRGLSGQA